MMFYLSNVAIAVNMSQPSVCIRGGLHALIHIFFTGGLKAPNRSGTLNTSLRFSQGGKTPLKVTWPFD